MSETQKQSTPSSSLAPSDGSPSSAPSHAEVPPPDNRAISDAGRGPHAEVPPPDNRAISDAGRGPHAEVPSPDNRAISDAERGARASLRNRVLFVLVLSTALVFAGLFFHQKRVFMKEMSTMTGSVRQYSADEAQLKRWQTMVFQKQKALRTADALVGLMADPSTVRVVLTDVRADEQGPSKARGQVFLGLEGGKLALFTFDLPPTAAPQRYQAWSVDAEGVRSSLGLLSDDQGGFRSLFMASPTPLPVAIEISLEPQATTETPSGTVILRGLLPVASQSAQPGPSQ